MKPFKFHPEAQRELLVADGGVRSYTLNARTERFLELQNIGAARVETDRDAGGVVYLDDPRSVFSGVRLAW